MIAMNRRRFLLGMSSLLVAPSIVRADSLMKVKGTREMAAEEIYAMWGNYVATLRLSIYMSPP